MGTSADTNPTRNLLFRLALLAILVQVCASKKLELPRKFRSEGKIFMEYVHESKTVKHYMAFTENVDLNQMKAAISIGYVSHNPIKYFSIAGQQPITISNEGVCSAITSYLGVEPILVGPTGLLRLLDNCMGAGGEMQIVPEKDTHRNVPCVKYSKSYNPQNSGFTITLDRLEPVDGVIYRGQSASMFSFKGKLLPTSEEMSKKMDVIELNFIIDYHVFDVADTQTTNYEQDIELNSPLGLGCSEFLAQISPRIDTQSFSMEYQQSSKNHAPTFLAYDHGDSFMRKELIGVSVSIWDLNTDIMYHIDQDATDRLLNSANQQTDHQPCAVLRVTDEKLGPAYRPYEKAGKSLDVLKFVGADRMSYLGDGMARDLPCHVYETIVQEPPALFALTEEFLQRSSSKKRDFIVQFYMLKSANRIGKEQSNPMVDEDFRPVKIVLYRRNVDLYSIEYIDSIDVYSFSWSLDGWDKKGNQLFMASECFTDINEQSKVGVSMAFDGVHDGAIRADSRKRLMSKRYKLEYDLTNDLLKLLGADKMNMVDYELTFASHHIGLEMIIGDRRDEMELTYFGAGSLTETSTNARNQIVLTGLTENRCIVTSSLINDISMTVYCPPSKDKPSFCTAVYSQRTPAFKKAITVDATEPTCQAYLYERLGDRPETATTRVNRNKDKLLDHSFEFEAPQESGQKPWTIKGKVINFDLSHSYSLIKIDRYAFTQSDTPIEADQAQTSSGVRSFNSIQYHDAGDCMKICNLDVNCRSYSYCQPGGDESGQCLISSLDIRADNVNGQLTNTRFIPLPDTTEFVVHVKGYKPGDKMTQDYALVFDDRCNIYERDYMSMYRQTDEVISLKRSMAIQFASSPTTFDCAKQSVDLEQKLSKHHVAMFAYCASTGTCLMDENLMIPKPVDNSTSTSGDSGELLCRLYRKKHQTNFKVTPKVLKLEPDQQVELKLNTVEDCARACWNQLGQICASFDFCSPGSCTINQLSNSKVADRDQELKVNCLHYERDLVLDELHKQNLVSKHQLLISHGEGDDKQSGFKDFLMSFVAYSLVFGAFIYGLVLGRRVNDKLEAVTIRGESVPMVNNESSGFRMPRSLDEASRELGLYESAIKMDVINSSASSSNES